jgi:hypothetical protein
MASDGAVKVKDLIYLTKCDTTWILNLEIN